MNDQSVQELVINNTWNKETLITLDISKKVLIQAAITLATNSVSKPYWKKSSPRLRFTFDLFNYLRQ